MAKIAYSFGVSSINGRLGGAIHQGGRWGQVIKSLPSRRPSPSIPQIEQRALFSTLIQKWQSLTDAMRSEWETYSEFYISFPTSGSTVKLDGFRVFMELNGNLLEIESAMISVPIWSSINPVRSIASLTSNDTYMIITMDAELSNIDYRPLLHCTPAFPLTTNVPGKRFYWVQPGEIESTILYIQEGYAQKFGSIQPHDTKIFLNYWIVDRHSGFKSNLVTGVFLHPSP